MLEDSTPYFEIAGRTGGEGKIQAEIIIEGWTFPLSRKFEQGETCQERRTSSSVTGFRPVPQKLIRDEDS